jgi:hypothetical protein
MSFVGHQYNLYLAAVYTNQYMPGQKQYDVFNEREKTVTAEIPNVLESFHYVGAQRFVDDMRKNDAKIFLDSGAFSAYTLGVKLRVEDYVGYILRNQDILRQDGGAVMASVLDGIGDPLETWRNQSAMEALGFRPLPCFHAGEDERYLEHYVANYEYITLGGMVGVSTKQLCTWLDRVWGRYLIDGSVARVLKSTALVSRRAQSWRGIRGTRLIRRPGSSLHRLAQLNTRSMVRFQYQIRVHHATTRDSTLPHLRR